MIYALLIIFLFLFVHYDKNILLCKMWKMIYFSKTSWHDFLSSFPYLRFIFCLLQPWFCKVFHIIHRVFHKKLWWNLICMEKIWKTQLYANWLKPSFFLVFCIFLEIYYDLTFLTVFLIFLLFMQLFFIIFPFFCDEF